MIIYFSSSTKIGKTGFQNLKSSLEPLAKKSLLLGAIFADSWFELQVAARAMAF
jgi:hypothetical protein